LLDDLDAIGADGERRGGRGGARDGEGGGGSCCVGEELEHGRRRGERETEKNREPDDVIAPLKYPGSWPCSPFFVIIVAEKMSESERVRELEEEVDRGKKKIDSLEKELLELKEESNILRIRKEKEGLKTLLSWRLP
jgi:hypothetical protein